MRIILFMAVTLVTATLAQAEWTQDKFEIGAWRAPISVYSTSDAVYARMAKAGISLLTGPGSREGEDVETNLKVLDLCRRHGIRLLVRDKRMHLDPQTVDDKRALDAMIADYASHPALYGYFIMDEPNPDAYRRLAELHAYLRAKDPAHLPYINLFPNYGGPTQLQFPDYDGYVQGFVESVRPLMLSFDHYPFLTTTERDNLFANLEVVRRDALKAGIPVWVIVQALQDATRYRPPTLNQMYWQVNCALVYGAKSIWYFPYWSAGDPGKPEEWHYLGVILPDGNPGPQYAAACEINPKLKRLGPLLMKLTSVSVGHLGDVPKRAKGFEPDDLMARASGDQIIIGRLADKAGKSILMLVNRDWDKPGKVSITLSKGTGVAEIGRLGPGDPLGAVEWNAASKTVSVTLAPGEGRLVRIRV